MALKAIAIEFNLEGTEGRHRSLVEEMVSLATEGNEDVSPLFNVVKKEEVYMPKGGDHVEVYRMTPKQEDDTE